MKTRIFRRIVPRRFWGRFRPEIASSLALLLLAACSSDPQPGPTEPADPPEVAIGERLFLETRFAQYFYAQNRTRVNEPLSEGDRVMDQTQTTGAPLPGPFAGQSMNCRACHLVDEQADFRAGGVRTYADFARHSPIPLRDDGRVTTPRNSPPLVDSNLPRSIPLFLHFDGEFASLSDLAVGTMTGRNFGWLANEKETAIAHIATVIRNDDGRGALAADFGALPYRFVLQGIDPSIPDAYLIPAQYRIDVDDATDRQVVDAVAALVGAYVESLVFAQDANGDFIGSPYDAFLAKNGLPRQPLLGESDLDYSRRLSGMIDALRSPRFVGLADGSFSLHAQEFAFGPQELLGLRIFLAEAGMSPNGMGTGNCIACHPAPSFTDFSFHNTGASQDEYDAIHGAGAFAALDVPDLERRNADPEIFLPPSAAHPNALGIFLEVPAPDRPGYADLGVWNVLGNPAVPAPQSGLESLLCPRLGFVVPECNAAELLPATIALFKTPGLRDLGQSAPYLHNGQMNSLEEVLDFYVRLSAQTRAGEVRNPAPELTDMLIGSADVAPLVAFLRALNEDYE